jgi:hypothetical protein
LGHVNPWIAYPAALAMLALIYVVMIRLWEPMGRKEAERRRSRNGTQEVSGVQADA